MSDGDEPSADAGAVPGADPFDRLPDRPPGEQVDLSTIVEDPGEVWSRLEVVETGRPVPTRDDRVVREVPIESYCRDCPHVADPPAFECTHEGTDILAVPSMDVARVADCPIVAERDRLDEEW